MFVLIYFLIHTNKKGTVENCSYGKLFRETEDTINKSNMHRDMQNERISINPF